MTSTRLCFLAVFAVFGGCSERCAKEDVSREPAPNGQLVASIFTDHCGAHGDFSTNISIETPNEDLPDRGTVFRLEGTAHSPVSIDSGGEGAPWAHVEWLSNEHLLVRYDASYRLLIKNDRFFGVRISYLAAKSRK